MGKEDGWKIITVSLASKNDKEKEGLFSKVCTRFYTTMAEAQGNYTITDVSVIVNSKLRKQYAALKDSFNKAGKQINEESRWKRVLKSHDNTSDGAPTPGIKSGSARRMSIVASRFPLVSSKTARIRLSGLLLNMLLHVCTRS